MPEELKIDRPQGIFKDLAAREVRLNAWTDGNNIQFVDGKTKKRKGASETLFGWSLAISDPSPSNTGQGAISGEGAGTSTVAETITITCTKDASSSPAAVAGSEEFSVTGSVSGALGTATVGTNFTTPQVKFLINRDASSPVVDFVVGDNFQIVITRVEPADDIHWMIPWETPDNTYWVWASLTKLYRWDSSTHEDVTRTTGGDYSADADKLWNGDILGDVVIANNSVDVPQYLGAAGSDFANFPVDTDFSPSDAQQWPENLRCKALRSYKQYLVAMNLTEGATDKPQNLRWSTAADPGSLPLWGIADPTLEAGETVLSATDGELVDGLQLGDSFIIYKTDSVWGMQLVGGQAVMRFYNVFKDAGLINVNCVQSFEGQHFCVGPNDIYVHNGNSKQSVISGKVRNTVYQRIEDSKIDRSYVAADYRNREMLFCYVKAGSSNSYPDEALVWNWQSQEVSFRTIPGSGAAHIAFGEILDFPEEVGIWDSDGQNWDSDNSEWGEATGKPTERRLLIPDTEGQTFSAEGRSTDDLSVPFRAWVERTGIENDQPTTIKHVYRVIPTITGSGSLDIYVGGEFNPSSGINWEGPFEFTVGEDYKIDCAVAGRSVAVRFESTDTAEWELSSYVLEGETSGKY